MKLRKQRLMGLALLAITALLLLLASTGQTTEDRDASAVLIILPLGVYMLASKTCILYDGDAGTEPPSRHSTRTRRRPRRSRRGGALEKGATTWQENAS